MENKSYYLGLDMGTASVGWAVTDEYYNILRKKGKDLWGIREFETANTAEERRTNRISRRRRQRQKERIAYLKDCFADAIYAVDPNFYIRLDNSKYYYEDKDDNVKSRNAIFNDKDYTDKDYFNQYPTIFHLRKELIENTNAPYDVRLVYLAVLNLFKRRGHFLNSSINVEDDHFSVNISEAYSNMISIINNSLDEEKALSIPELIDSKQANDLQNILTDRKLSKKLKAESIFSLLSMDKKDKRLKELVNGIVGLEINCSKLFKLEDEEQIKAKFSDFSYSEKEPEILEKLGETYGEILISIKNVYDSGALAELLKGNSYLSFARVKDYEQHKSDKRVLKDLVIKYCKEEYDWLFRKAEPGSYSAYVNSTNSDKYNKDRYDEKGPNRRGMDKNTKDEFYKSVKKIISKMPQDDPNVIYILNSIENDTFMPKQLTGANGIIPNQLHAIELKKILDNASEYLDFLNDVDDTGLTVKERLLKLYMFTLPYYVGPTSEKSKTGWVIRKEQGKVYPWNIEDKIDIEGTEKKFIEHMVRRCTYFMDEQVLPKSSMKYELYCVLNEINNIKIDNIRIDNSLKKSIIENLFMKKGKVTRNALEKYMYLNGVPQDAQITGIDKELNNSLSSYKRFYELFGEEIKKDSVKNMIEDIIMIATIYGDSKDRMKKVIRNKYPESEYSLLTDKVVNRIAGYKFKDWGRLSSKLLDMEGCNRSTGEVYSLLTAMYETNYNFIELINSDEFDYKDRLKDIETKSLGSLSQIDSELLDRYYFSAPVKRMITQTLGVIREIVQVMGCLPERVFIEMTRSDEEKGDKGRKDSREKDLHNLLASIKKEIDYGYWDNLVTNESNSGRLKSKKMYLYIKQNGIDMYTGNPIDLDDLFDSNKYDIDHIYPQRYVKDNNLENNMVLTSKEANEHIKKDIYPIPDKIRRNPKVVELWDRLHRLGLINDVKYSRLRCSEPFTEYQQAEFIARQVVETGQGTKGVADILKQVLPGVTIVYSKAGNVSDFRNNNNSYKNLNHKFYKSRLVNDFHHAHDAYLNIVVGNVYFTKFTQNPMNYIHKEYKRDPEKFKYNMRRMYDWKIERNGKVAWVPKHSADEIGTIDTVIKMMSKNTPLLSRRSFVKQGVINKVTLYGKHKAKPESYIPLKSSDFKMNDVTKYGGYTSVNISYFFLVEYEKKGKKMRVIEGLPGYIKDKVDKDPTELEKYCKEVLGLENFDIRYRKIPIQSLLRINGYYVYLAGKSDNNLLLRNAIQLIIPSDLYNYVHLLELMDESKKTKLDSNKNLELYDELIKKLHFTICAKCPNSIVSKLEEHRENFCNLDDKKQAITLLKILKHFKVNSDGVADLSDIQGEKEVGKIRYNKNITKIDEFLLYNQSFTGLYDSLPVDLLKI